MIWLFGAFGLLLSIVVALDKIAKIEWKNSKTKALISWSGSDDAELRLGRLINKLFGKKLISFRAFLVSATISIISTTILFLSLKKINPDSFDDSIEILQGSLDSSLILIFIIILSAILADFFSFLQTRIFIKSAREIKSQSAKLILVLCDLISSLIIFCLVFAMGYTMALRIFANSSQNMEFKELTYIPAAYELLLEIDDLNEIDDILLASSLTKKDVAIDLYKFVQFVSNNQNIDLNLASDYFSTYYNNKFVPGYTYIDVSISENCFDNPDLGLDKILIEAETIAQLSELVSYASKQKIDSIFESNDIEGSEKVDVGEAWFRENSLFNKLPVLNSYLYTKFQSSKNCDVTYLKISPSLNRGKLISNLTIGDHYLATLQIMLQNSSRSALDKFGSFTNFVVGDDLFHTVAIGRQKTILKPLASGDYQLASADEINFLVGLVGRSPDGRFGFPFSTFLLSAMTASAAFLVTIFFNIMIISIRGLSKRTVTILSSIFNMEESFFSAFILPTLLLLSFLVFLVELFRYIFFT